MVRYVREKTHSIADAFFTNGADNYSVNAPRVDTSSDPLHTHTHTHTLHET
jgi:hypothetical protein